jgi:hypothetical protein
MTLQWITVSFYLFIDGWQLNDDLKGRDHDLTDELSRYLPKGSEENNERFQNEQAIPRPKYEPSSSRRRVTIVAATPTHSV